MSTRAGRLIRAVVLVVILTASWSAAEAQQWKIYLLGQVDPIVADLYVEDTPWILFHDDQSMYVFAVGCNRVERVERDGVALPPPNCPIEKLPTSMPRVYLAILELEAKRLEDTIKKLRAQTSDYQAALTGAAAAAPAGITPQEASMSRQRFADAARFLQAQISDSLLEIRFIDVRVGKLLDSAKSFPPSEKQRFFFATR